MGIENDIVPSVCEYESWKEGNIVQNIENGKVYYVLAKPFPKESGWYVIIAEKWVIYPMEINQYGSMAKCAKYRLYNVNNQQQTNSRLTA